MPIKQEITLLHQRFNVGPAERTHPQALVEMLDFDSREHEDVMEFALKFFGEMPTVGECFSFQVETVMTDATRDTIYTTETTPETVIMLPAIC